MPIYIIDLVVRIAAVFFDGATSVLLFLVLILVLVAGTLIRACKSLRSSETDRRTRAAFLTATALLLILLCLPSPGTMRLQPFDFVVGALLACYIFC